MSSLFIKTRLMNYDTGHLATENELKRRFLDNLFMKYQFGFPRITIKQVRDQMFGQLDQYPNYASLEYYAFRLLYQHSAEVY